jgi:hypothetical protein
MQEVPQLALTHHFFSWSSMGTTLACHYTIAKDFRTKIKQQPTSSSAKTNFIVKVN